MDEMPTEKAVPTLLHLTYSQFARWLCVEQIKRTPVPENSSNFEQTYFDTFETRTVQMLREKFALDLPKMCLDTTSEYVHDIVEDLRGDLQDLSLVPLMCYMMKSTKWRYLAASWWSSCWQQAGETFFLTLFESVMQKSDKKGLHAIPEDDLAIYLHVWHAAPETLKLDVFANLSRAYTRKTRFPQGTHELFGWRRNLEFLTKLFADFDLPTRLELWARHWQDLMYGVKPKHLEPLMRLCGDSARSFREFKAAWLSKPETIEKCYCVLIDSHDFVTVNEFLSFYSSNYSKVLDLAILTIRTFFILTPLPESYKFLHRIYNSNGWLSDAIEADELRYLWRTDEEKLKSHYYTLIRKAEYYNATRFLQLFVPEEDVPARERSYTESFFMKTYLPHDERNYLWLGYEVFDDLRGFDEFLARVFGSTDEAARFKKRMIYTPTTMTILSDQLSSENEITRFEKFVKLCLSSDEEIAEWEDAFMRNNVKALRKWLKLGSYTSHPSNVVEWCVKSEQRLAKFKSMITIDELFEIMGKCNSTRRCKFSIFSEFFAFDVLLRKIYPELEDRIEYKLQKLREYPNDDDMVAALLAHRKEQFQRLRDATPEELRAVVASTCDF